MLVILVMLIFPPWSGCANRAGMGRTVRRSRRPAVSWPFDSLPAPGLYAGESGVPPPENDIARYKLRQGGSVNLITLV